MVSSLKYYISRLITGIAVLLIVLLILSSIFTYYNYERRKVDIKNALGKQIHDNSTIEDMTYEERLEWKDNRVKELRKFYGIEDPYWKRTFGKTFNVFRGELGEADYLQTVMGPQSQKVMDIIWEVFPNSVLLYATSAALYIIIGLFWGLKSVQKSDDDKKSNLLIVGSMIASSLPMWWVGMIFLMVFAFHFDIFPGSSLPFPATTGIDYYLGVLYRMALPVITIVLTMVGAKAYATRNLIRDVLDEEYIMASRAKGTPEKNVIYGHALKTASPSIISNAMRTFLLTLPALIVTEAIFGWPGIGLLYYRATVVSRDIPVILGLTFFNAIIYVSIWLISDLFTGFLDPRIKFGDNK